MAPIERPYSIPPWRPIMSGVVIPPDDEKEPVAMDTATTSSADAASINEKAFYQNKVEEMKGGEFGSTENLVRYESRDVESSRGKPVEATTETIALKALHVDDDPTLNPWTFRMFFLGTAIHPR